MLTSYAPELVNVYRLNGTKIAQIVQRDPNQVKKSLSALPEKKRQKLHDICNNYNKVLRYGKLIELKDFKTEIESELGRSLSDKQIRHSQISIKKVQFYVENILDGKFETHLTHGINHVKHNFEYGYRLVGLISNTKSRIKKAFVKIYTNELPISVVRILILEHIERNLYHTIAKTRSTHMFF